MIRVVQDCDYNKLELYRADKNSDYNQQSYNLYREQYNIYIGLAIQNFTTLQDCVSVVSDITTQFTKLSYFLVHLKRKTANQTSYFKKLTLFATIRFSKKASLSSR